MVNIILRKYFTLYTVYQKLSKLPEKNQTANSEP